MGCNCQCPHSSEPRQARQGHYLLPLVSQSLATGHDLVHAQTTEDSGSPESHLPFNGTYPSQLELLGEGDTLIPSSRGTLEPTAKATEQVPTTVAKTLRITTHDTNFNDDSKVSYLPIMRPWKEQFPSSHGAKLAYSDQISTPLAVWESQVPFEEPFSTIGEVAVKAAHGQQDEPFHRPGRLRQGRRKKRRGL